MEEIKKKRKPYSHRQPFSEETKEKMRQSSLKWNREHPRPKKEKKPRGKRGRPKGNGYNEEHMIAKNRAFAIAYLTKLLKEV
jgi:hypothetical protein